MFNRWGHFVYRFRWAMLVGAVGALALSVAGIFAGGNIGGPQSGSIAESDRAANLVAAELPKQAGNGGSSFILLFGSTNLTVADPLYRSALERAIAPLITDPRVTTVTTPYGQSSAGLISRDLHKAVVVVQVKDKSTVAARYLSALRAELNPGPLTLALTGNVPINQAFNTTLENDLQKAELVSLPLALILLMLIFRSAIAAALPVAIGVLTIAGGVAATLLVSNVIYVSQYAFNIVTLIGLGVSIDYSLMFVSRFREELAAGSSVEQAVATTMATAGRAISFSGITFAIGLSSLLFFQGTFLTSLGIAGAIVVALAVVYGLTLLPAMLAVLGGGVNRLRLPGNAAAVAGDSGTRPPPA